MIVSAALFYVAFGLQRRHHVSHWFRGFRWRFGLWHRVNQTSLRRIFKETIER